MAKVKVVRRDSSTKEQTLIGRVRMTWQKPLADGSLPPAPHDNSGHTWHHADAVLIGIIADGGDPTYNSKMPAFKDKMTEAQMRAMLAFIKTSWGKEEREFQWWMTATSRNGQN